MSLDNYESKIYLWHRDRGIPVSAEKAIIKFFEEGAELAEGNFKENPELVKDAVGDVFVTLVGVCMAYGLTMEECVAHAWDEIKDRKGVVKGGVFQKDE